MTRNYRFLFGLAILTLTPVSAFLATRSLAQEETLVGEGFHSGGYGGPVWKAGLLNGKVGMFSGGRGAWIINRRFAIGGGTYDLITDVESDEASSNGEPLHIDLEYGGLEMEYIHHSEKLLHWTIHTMLGGGTVSLLEHHPSRTVETDNIFVVEPSLNMDINASSWFRIGLGASYPMAMGLDLGGITNSDINGPSGLIILKFGSF